MSRYTDFVNNYLFEGNNTDWQKVLLNNDKITQDTFIEFLKKCTKLDKDSTKINYNNIKINLVDIANFIKSKNIKKNTIIEWLKDDTNEVNEDVKILFNTNDSVFLKTLDKKSNNDTGFGAKKTHSERFNVYDMLSDWSKFAEILTYKSIETMHKAADRDDEIDEKELHSYMEAAFKTEKTNYISQFADIDSRMQLDAAKATIQEAIDRKEITEQTLINLGIYSLLNEKALILNEEDEAASEPAADASTKTPKEDKQEGEKTDTENAENKDEESNDASNEDAGNNDIIPKSPDSFADKTNPRNKKLLTNQIQAVKKKWPERFDKHYNEIKAEFDKARQRVIKDEQSDEKENHTDPITGKVEKRIGHLGSNGPMTFINNNKYLSAAVNKIDGQDWNIFNFAAKLLIKLFKFIEKGSKFLTDLKNDMDAAKRQIKDALKAEKIPQFKQQMLDAEDIKTLVMTLCIEMSKYEAKLLEAFKECITFEEVKDEPDYLQFSEKAINTFNNALELQKQALATKEDFLKSVDALKTEEENNNKEEEAAKEEEKAKESSEENKEAPQQSDSTHRTFKSFINEDGVNPVEGEEESGEEQAEDSAAAEGEVKEESEVEESDEDAKAEEEKNDLEKNPNKALENDEWRNQKYDFDFPIEDSLSIDRESAETAATLFEAIKNTVEGGQDIFDTCKMICDILPIAEGGDSNRLFNEDEVHLSTITAGEMIDRLNALDKTLKSFKKLSQAKFKLPDEINPDDYKDNELLQLTNKNKEDKEDNGADSEIVDPNASNLEKLSNNVEADITQSTKENYKKTIESLKKQKETAITQAGELFEKLTEIKEKKEKAGTLTDEDKNKYNSLVKLLHSDKLTGKHIIPVIFSYGHALKLYTINPLKEAYHIYRNRLYEAIEKADDFKKGISKSIVAAVASIPSDYNDAIYEKTEDQWLKDDYAKFTNEIKELVEFMNIEKVKTKFEKVIDYELINNENGDPLLKLETVIGLYDEPFDEENGEKEGETEDVQDLAQQSNELALALPNQVKKKTLDKTTYEKMYNKIQELTKASEAKIEKNKGRIDSVIKSALESEPAKDSIIKKMYYLNRLLWLIANKKYGMEESYELPISLTFKLNEEFNKDDVIAKIKQANEFVNTFDQAITKYSKDLTSKDAENFYYKQNSIKSFEQKYKSEFIDPITSIHAQIKELIEKDADKYEDDIKQVISNGPGKVDLYLILIAAEQAMTEDSQESADNKEDNKEENSSENNGQNNSENKETEDNQEGEHNDNTDEVPESIQLDFEDELLTELYKYIEER